MVQTYKAFIKIYNLVPKLIINLWLRGFLIWYRLSLIGKVQNLHTMAGLYQIRKIETQKCYSSAFAGTWEIWLTSTTFFEIFTSFLSRNLFERLKLIESYRFIQFVIFKAILKIFKLPHMSKLTFTISFDEGS